MPVRMPELLGDTRGPFGARHEARRAADAVLDELQKLLLRLVHLQRNAERLRHVPRHVDEYLEPVALWTAEVAGNGVAVRHRAKLGDRLVPELAVSLAQRGERRRAKRDLLD